ncbi:MAG: hypothetical protein KDI13_02605 [Alphaproteobacteria bacterium]|nr:hypothetical protein [Alphaproteobacteria bacterium]
MRLIDELKQKFPDITDWQVEQGKRHEKERINQSTETIEFLAISPDQTQKRRFIYTNFSDCEGTKESWREV